MPKKNNPIKSATLSVRVTPYVKELIESVAHMEGFTASEWVRVIIMKELKDRGALKMMHLEAQLEKLG